MAWPTILASLFGAPANTTYGENTGVLALTKVFDPRVIRLAALFAIAFSFCPKFAAVIAAMPACVIGGVSFVGGIGKIRGIVIGVLLLRLIFVGLNMASVNQDLIYLVKGGIILFACALDMRKYLVKK
mgnify:CR=1 FL=1